MPVVAVVAAIAAALLHVYIFALESLWFDRETVWRRFGLSSQSDARVVRSFAFNQGFYNLFLAIGVAIGLALVALGHADAGRAIVAFACASMVAAGLVLAIHDQELIRAAVVQMTPGLIALVAIALLSPETHRGRPCARPRIWRGTPGYRSRASLPYGLTATAVAEAAAAV